MVFRSRAVLVLQYLHFSNWVDLLLRPEGGKNNQPTNQPTKEKKTQLIISLCDS